MGTAGDDYLRRLLGDNEPSTATSGRNHDTTVSTEIDDAEAKRRAEEHQRAFEARFSVWDTPQTATATMHSSGGGGYKFDAETIKSKITQWEQLLTDLRADGAALQQAMQAAEAPSADRPAVRQVEATRTSITAAIDHNKKMRDYAIAYITALKKANGTYTEHDAEVAAAMKSPTTDTGKLYQ